MHKCVTSISDNGSTVVDKRGLCWKTQLKISDNEKNQYIYAYILKKNKKNRFLAKKKNKDKTKTKTTKWKQK